MKGINRIGPGGWGGSECRWRRREEEAGREGRRTGRGEGDGEVRGLLLLTLMPNGILYPLVACKSPYHGSRAGSMLLELGSSLARLLCPLFCLCVLKSSTA